MNLSPKPSVFHGFDCLIGGFNNTTFSPENLVRYRPQRTSFYLHLHGSPLYYTDRQGDVRKANRDQLINVIGNSATHVVLTHVRHKMNVVSASDLLRSYWESLDVALDEAREVVLFGYSGLDDHLNRRILAHGEHKLIHVVEWSGGRQDEESRLFWEGIFSYCKITRLPNILEYRNW